MEQLKTGDVKSSWAMAGAGVGAGGQLKPDVIPQTGAGIHPACWKLGGWLGLGQGMVAMGGQGVGDGEDSTVCSLRQSQILTDLGSCGQWGRGDASHTPALLQCPVWVG